MSDAELGLLRGAQPDLANATRIAAEARDRVKEDRHAHPTIKRLRETDWVGAGEIACPSACGAGPLRALAQQQNSPQTREWIKAHDATVRALIAQAPGEESDAIEDVPILSLLFEELAQAQDFHGGLSLDDYAIFFDTAARETAVRRQRTHHPRIKSLGLLEARLMSADVAVLAGLDETVWPPAAKTDAFLSRPMRAALG